MTSGILILDKPEGITSAAAVSRVKRLFGGVKVGHTGTLDPLATGVLPLLLGSAVKASGYLMTGDKHYRATLTLGVTTDTEDCTGTTLSTCDDVPTEAAVKEAASAFLGEGTQIPPMYSAIKVGGKKLYDIARAGGEIERAPRPIRIDRLDVTKIDERIYVLDVVCSKGTYIRTLCADVGRALGCGGVMSALRRVSAAGFSLEDAVTLETLENDTPTAREKRLIPVEEVFKNDEKLELSPFFSRLARNGQQIYLHKIGHAPVPVGTRFRLHDGAGFFAVGEVTEYDDGLAVKPLAQFDV